MKHDRRSRRLVFTVVAAASAITLSATAATASAPPVDLGLVSETQATTTPNVVSGGFPADNHTQVWGYVPMNGVMYACGDFAQVKSPDGQTTYDRANLFAFDPNSGAVSDFAPATNGPVETCVASPDGTALYIGGDFTTVNGQPASHIAEIDAATGQLVPSFQASANNIVTELAVTHDRLMVGGSFSTIDGQAQRALATVTLDSGAFDRYMNLQIDGQAEGATSGPTRVYRFAVNPAQNQVVAIGNFTSVNGVKHQNAFRFSMRNRVKLLNWDNPRFYRLCGPTLNMPVWSRDVQFSPDGTYFVIDGTGGADSTKDHQTLCDTATRWESAARGTNVQPTWRNHTCIDTLHSVAVTSAAVYVQGHQKCVMGPGGVQVPRYGIAALDPLTGMALSWRSDQSRQVGGKYLMVTDPQADPGFPAGLWSGCDCHTEGSVIFRPEP